MRTNSPLWYNHLAMAKKVLPKWATTVTPFSKYLAMVLFILFPFVGFYLGYQAGVNHPATTLPATKLIAYPTVIPTPTISLSEMPDELKVSRSVTSLVQKTNNPMVPFKTISDPTIVQKLYSTILALPPFPTPYEPNLSASCAFNAQRILYDLNFFKNNKLLRHGILSYTACGGGLYVILDGTYKREFTSDRNLFASFRTLLENSFGVTARQLVGFD
jgi:hypothetical protein